MQVLSFRNHSVQNISRNEKEKGKEVSGLLQRSACMCVRAFFTSSTQWFLARVPQNGRNLILLPFRDLLLIAQNQQEKGPSGKQGSVQCKASNANYG